jgi:hypothetical protein
MTPPIEPWTCAEKLDRGAEVPVHSMRVRAETEPGCSSTSLHSLREPCMVINLLFPLPAGTDSRVGAWLEKSPAAKSSRPRRPVRQNWRSHSLACRHRDAWISVSSMCVCSSVRVSFVRSMVAAGKALMRSVLFCTVLAWKSKRSLEVVFLDHNAYMNYYGQLIELILY